MTDRWAKDPSAVLDYKFDWSDWLASGETISTKTVTVTTGITVDSSSITDDATSVTVWLSGGTAGTLYTVTCEIDTSASRTDQRSMFIKVEDR